MLDGKEMVRMYKFKFSIVMAVYNVEQFLTEAIESVLKQDIGFEENVQLILVNDGSKDSSGKICDLYQAKYPNNIVVVHKENGGVSLARNEGLKYVEGKYVNFLDSDDKITLNTLRIVGEFFEKNFNYIDAVTIPMIFFDAKSGGHVLNYKFSKRTRVIDLTREYNCITLSTSSTFLKRNDVSEFDEKLSYCEDAKLLLSILQKKQTIGVVNECKYLYRRRPTGNSAVQNSTGNKNWYVPCLQNFMYKQLVECKNNLGYIPKFVQYTIAYYLQWYLLIDVNKVNTVLDETEQKSFYELLTVISRDLDDDVILKQKNIHIEHKVFLLKKKYNDKIHIKFLGSNNVSVFIKNIFLEDLNKRGICLDFCEVTKENFIIKGRLFSLYELEKVAIDIVCDENAFASVIHKQKTNIGQVLNEQSLYEVNFTTIIPKKSLKEDNKLNFIIRIGNNVVKCEKISTKNHFPIEASLKYPYVIIDEFVLTIENNSLCIRKAASFTKIIKEALYLIELVRCKKLGAKKIAALRFAYFLLKPFMPRDIWLISDRINKADDNGEAFLKFLHDNKLHKNTYFVIKKDSADNAVVKQYGKVLDHYSLKHRLMHLFATKIISSVGDDYVFCPFWGRKYIKDILWYQKRIFLQHGITKDDISGWLNKYSKNLDLFITAGKAEYNSILEGNYFYDDNVVKLTGFARYDRLENKRKKIITIMPTWRASLTNAGDYAITGKDNYNDAFFESDYFKFYNDLISHPELLACAKKYGYKIKFMPHPRVIPYVDSFSKNELVEFCHIDTKYRDIFGESALVLTDYSSVAFDFAYLRKPVMYTHFDKEEFFRGQVYDQGYFDYERDGFGEVEYNLEDTAKRIIEYIQNDCQLKDVYRKRIDKFFAFNDRNNCQRIYDEIIKL